MPTHAPTGSMRPSLVYTAIFARDPGFLAAARISMMCSAISGTSTLNSSISISGSVRDNMSCGPRTSGRISVSSARMRSPTRKISLGINDVRINIASALLPRSTITASRVVRLTEPLTSCPTLGRYFSRTWARSASRTFWVRTCLAACAAMRPNSTDSTGISKKSPISSDASFSFASSGINSASGLGNSSSSSSRSGSTTSQQRNVS